MADLGACSAERPAPLGWWTIHGETLLEALREAAETGQPDLVYAELYANSEHEDYSDE